MNHFFVNRESQDICDDGIHLKNISVNQYSKCEFLTKHTFLDYNKILQNMWNKYLQEAIKREDEKEIKRIKKRMLRLGLNLNILNKK